MAWNLPSWTNGASIPEFEPAITTPFETIPPGGDTPRTGRHRRQDAIRREPTPRLSTFTENGRWIGRTWTAFGFEGIAEAVDAAGRLVSLEPVPLPAVVHTKPARSKRRQRAGSMFGK